MGLAGLQTARIQIAEEGGHDPLKEFTQKITGRFASALLCSDN